MKTKKRIIPALVFSLFAAFGAAESSAAQFSNVYVFGDSLSDAGYYRPFLASLGLPASLVATLGPLHDQPGSRVVRAGRRALWRDEPAPQQRGRHDLRAGRSARGPALGQHARPARAQRPVSTQIDEFLAAGGGAADPECALRGLGRRQRHPAEHRPAPGRGRSPPRNSRPTCSPPRPRKSDRSRACAPPAPATSSSSALPDVGATPAVRGRGRRHRRVDHGALRGLQHDALHGPRRRRHPRDPGGHVRALHRRARQCRRVRLHQRDRPGVRAVPAHHDHAQLAVLHGGQHRRRAGRRYLFADSVHPTPARAGASSRTTCESLIDGPAQYSLLAGDGAAHARGARAHAGRPASAPGTAARSARSDAFVAARRLGLRHRRQPGPAAAAHRRHHVSRSASSARVSENVTVGAAFGTQPLQGASSATERAAIASTRTRARSSPAARGERPLRAAPRSRSATSTTTTRAATSSWAT